MMNLVPHHRFHIPNGLAMTAALLLLISSVVGSETRHEVYSSDQNIMPSATIESTENSNANDTAQRSRRGLNLGLLLFRRG